MTGPTSYPPGGDAPRGAAPPTDAPTAMLPTSSPVQVARDVRPGRSSVPAAPPAAAAAVPRAVPLAPPDRDRAGRGPQRRRRPAPLAWLPWALLGALLFLLALMLLAGTVIGATQDDATDVARDGRVAGPVAPGSSAEQDGAAPGTGARAAAGTLTVDGADVLADAASLRRLGSLQGQEAVGRNVEVQSVVADEGFWVGPSAAQRTFVFLTPQARQGNSESGYQVAAGQRVDLSGTVTTVGTGDAEAFGVTDREGADQLNAQRAYVRAARVGLTS